jgi:amino acid permease
MVAFQTNELKHGLKTRHVTMILLAGSLGRDYLSEAEQ